jgi:hypothetical protein
MAIIAQNDVGSVASLWRYPVKSMMGEELNATEVTRVGLPGDRAFALVDRSDGKVASAKNPRKWPRLFEFRAAFVDAPGIGMKAPPVRITLPDGTFVSSEQPDVHRELSVALNREVALSSLSGQADSTAEAYWPDIEGLERKDTVTDFALP